MRMDLRPLGFERQLSDPAVDTGQVQGLTLNRENLRGIPNLSLRIAKLGPLQLCHDEVLSPSDGQFETEETKSLAVVELGDTEGAVLPDYEVGLPPRAGVYRVELTANPHGLFDRFVAHVEPAISKSLRELQQNFDALVDNEIHVLSCPRRSVVRRGQ